MHHDLLQECCLEGTGQWFINHPSYVAWKESTTSNGLWLRGNPGCGKSVLASLAINDLEQEVDFCHALAFVYCRASDAGSTTSQQLACTLLRQLCEQSARIDVNLQRAYKSQGDVLKEGPQPSLVKESLRAVSSTFETVSIVVDGLDECVDMERIAKLLFDLVAIQTSCVKVLAVSRPNYADLDDTLLAWQKLDIMKETDDDITHYISSLVTADKLRVGSFGHIIPEVKEELTKKANGSFLWVSLTVKELQQQARPSDILLAAQKVPGDLNSAYTASLQRILSQRNPFKKRTAISLLLWTLNATRPLSASEMLEVLQIEPGMTYLDEMQIRPDTRGLTELCNDLVVLSADDTFVLCHGSLKDYIESLSEQRDDIFSEIHKQQQNVQSTLSILCLTYLSLDNFERLGISESTKSEDLFQVHPFLLYAVDHLRTHCDKSEDSRIPQMIHQLAKAEAQRNLCIGLLLSINGEKHARIFTRTSTTLHFIAAYGDLETASLLTIEGRGDPGFDSHGFSPLDYAFMSDNETMALWSLELCSPSEHGVDWNMYSPIHSAATKGWATLMERLLDQGYDPDSQVVEHNATPLMRAIQSSQKRVAGILIHKGANVDKRDKDGDTALYYLQGPDLVDLGTMLLEAGADINSVNGCGYTLLNEAVILEDLAKIEFLLSRGADIHAVNEKESSESALHHAASTSNPLIVRKLLENKDIVVDAVNELKQTPLFVAAAFGSVAIMKDLVHAGADPYTCTNTGHQIIHIAAGNPKLDILKYVVEELGPADIVNAKDEDGWTPLHYSVLKGCIDAVQYLLLKDAIIDTPSKGDLITPFLLAVAEGHMDIAILLEKSNANVRARDADDHEARHHTADSDHSSIAELLAANRIDPNAKNGDGLAAVHFFAARGDTAFLEHMCRIFPNLNINLKNPKGETALFMAAKLGHASMVKLLCQRKAELMPDNNGDTPLHAAAKGNHTGIALFLLDVVPIDEPGCTGRTPLYYAVIRGRMEMTELLLTRGACIEARDVEGRYAIIRAVDAGHSAIAKLLLRLNHTMKCRNPDGRTLLHAAVAQDDEDLVEFLLERGCGTFEAGNQSLLPPFLEAVDRGSLKLVKTFLSHDCDRVVLKTEYGSTCIHLTAWAGDLSMLELLVKFGADVSAADSSGETAMHVAARGNHRNMISALTKYGASSSTRTHSGCTSLHYAADFRSVPCVAYLVEQMSRKDLNAVDHVYGRTALHIAAGEDAVEIAEILLRAGAAYDKVDALGYTALQRAEGREPITSVMKRWIASYHRPLTDQQRAVTLRNTSQRLAGLLLQESEPRTPAQSATRIEASAAIATALCALDRITFELEIRQILLQLCFNPRGLILQVNSICSVCESDTNSKKRAYCSFCYESVLCAECYSKFRDPTYQFPPAGFDAVQALEKEMGALCVALEENAEDLSAIASALQVFPEAKEWVEGIYQRYEAWDKNHNGDKTWHHYRRHDHERLKLISQALIAWEEEEDDDDDDNDDDEDEDAEDEDDEDEDDEDKDDEDDDEQEAERRRDLQREALSKEWLKSMRWHHCTREPRKGFLCSEHDFIVLQPEDWESVKQDEKCYDMDGVLTKAWLRRLLMKLEKSQKLDCHFDPSTMTALLTEVEDDPGRVTQDSQMLETHHRMEICSTPILIDLVEQPIPRDQVAAYEWTCKTPFSAPGLHNSQSYRIEYDSADHEMKVTALGIRLADAIFLEFAKNFSESWTKFQRALAYAVTNNKLETYQIPPFATASDAETALETNPDASSFASNHESPIVPSPWNIMDFLS